jgi:hypothetical protein
MKTPNGGMNSAPKASTGPKDLDKFQTITGTLKTSGEQVRMIRGPQPNPDTGRMEVEIEAPKGTTGTVTVPWDIFVPHDIPDMDTVDVGERPEDETSAPSSKPAPKTVSTSSDEPVQESGFKKGVYALAARGDRGVDRLGSFLRGSKGAEASPDTDADLTPAERAKKERVKLSSMIGTFKELMKKPEIETVEMTPQSVIRDRRETRAQEFAERLGISDKREELKAAGSRLQEEYTKFYGSALAGAREKLGKKPASLIEAEEAFAKESEKYGKEMLDYASNVGDIERKRAIAFNLRDTVYGKEEMRIAAREAAQTEKQKQLHHKVLGWAGRGLKGAVDMYKSGTDTLGRGVAATLALERGETAETLDKEAFEKDARFYANASRLLGASALGAAAFSATPLAALGFGGNLAWRAARGTIGMIAGQRFALIAQKAWKESDEENRINELKEFRKKTSFTADEVRAFQDSYASGNVQARRGRRAIVGTVAAIVGGAGTTGLMAGAEGITTNMDRIPAAASWVDAKLTDGAAPVIENIREQFTTDLEKSERADAQFGSATEEGTPGAVAAPAEAPLQAPIETPVPQTPESPEVAEPKPEVSETLEAGPEVPPAAPVEGEPVQIQPESETDTAEAPVPAAETAPGNVEVVAKPGDGFDRMFASLQDQLREQYASVPAAEIPPSVQHILDATHENVLSREFGLAWTDAVDNSASAPVEVGDKFVVEDGKFTLVRADGTSQEFMDASGKQTYTYEHETPSAPVAPTETAPETPGQPVTEPATQPVSPEAATPAPEPVPQQPAAAEAVPTSRPLTIADTLTETRVPQAPSVESGPEVGERPLTIAEIVEGLDELSTAAETTPNEHGVVVDPSRQSLYEWDVPNATANSLFAAGPVTERYLSDMANQNPGVPVLYEYTETNAFGVETKEVRGVMRNAITGAVEPLPREVTSRIPLPNPNDFVRVIAR